MTLTFLSQIQNPLSVLSVDLHHLAERLQRSAACEVSVPINACSNCAERGKETLRGLGVANVRNYYLT